MLGIVAADQLLDGAEMPAWLLLPLTAAAGAAFLLVKSKALPYLFTFYCYIPISLAMIALWSWIRSFFPALRFPILNFMGRHSLELYLTHFYFCRIIQHYALWERLPRYCWYFIVFGISIVLSALLKNLSNSLDRTLYSVKQPN